MAQMAFLRPDLPPAFESYPALARISHTLVRYFHQAWTFRQEMTNGSAQASVSSG
jgi:hypothetical protein